MTAKGASAFGIALLATLAIGVACTDSAEPTAVEPEVRLAAGGELGPDVVATVVGGGGGPIFNAPGGAPFLGYLTVGVRERSDGSVDGSFGFDLHAPPGPQLVAARVDATCLFIDGNQAWVSGPVVWGRGFAAGDVGQTAFVFVEDGGVGQDLVQFAPIVFADPPATDCTDRPTVGPPGAGTGDYRIIQ
jgi:hypothetical protein